MMKLLYKYSAVIFLCRLLYQRSLMFCFVAGTEEIFLSNNENVSDTFFFCFIPTLKVKLYAF